MNTLHFHCPLCAGGFQVEASLAGHAVTCPVCRQLVQIPALTPPAGAAAVRFACPHCQGGFEVVGLSPETYATCPHCGGTVLIPAGPAALPADRPTAPELPASESTPSAAAAAPTADPASPQASAGASGEAPRATSTAPPQSQGPGPRTAPRAAASAESFYPPGFRPAAPEGLEELLPPIATETAGGPSPRGSLSVGQLDRSAAGGAAPGSHPIPTGAGGQVALREPTGASGSGDHERDVPAASAEAKARRRLRNNLVLAALCVVLVGVVTAVLLSIGPIRW